VFLDGNAEFLERGLEAFVRKVVLVGREFDHQPVVVAGVQRVEGAAVGDVVASTDLVVGLDDRLGSTGGRR
jgi:hypothetical protein